MKISQGSKITSILIARNFNIIEEKIPPKCQFFQNDKFGIFFQKMGIYKNLLEYIFFQITKSFYMTFKLLCITQCITSENYAKNQEFDPLYR